MKDKLICWDTSVLIEYMTEKEPGRIRDIQTVIQSIDSGQYKLTFSTLVYVEVLESTMPGKSINKFDEFLENIDMVTTFAVDVIIAKKAQNIRNRIPKTISTPDAVHIATAIVSGAQFFHTFDGALLKLSGTPEVDGIAITACTIPEMNYSFL